MPQRPLSPGHFGVWISRIGHQGTIQGTLQKTTLLSVLTFFRRGTSTWMLITRGRPNVEILLSAEAKCVAEINYLFSAETEYSAKITAWYSAKTETETECGRKQNLQYNAFNKLQLFFQATQQLDCTQYLSQCSSHSTFVPIRISSRNRIVLCCKLGITVFQHFHQQDYYVYPRKSDRLH